MKKHSCIKEFEIPKQAYDYDSYNGFTYSYILVVDTPSPTEKDKVHPKGKMYHGAHGSDDEDVNANIDDPYHQSCRDKDFRLLYSSGKPVFKLVINELFTNWSEAKNAEHIFLKKERTKNPEMFFNNHNGFSTHKLIDRDKVHKLVNEIKKRENNKFGWNLEDKKNHEETNISSFQVRYEEDKKHELDVMHLLNDNEGVTDITKNKNIDPVVICENRGVCGRDVRIDGNITTAAILHKKSLAEKVPTIRIPEEVHKEYTDDELRHAALMLNKREQKIKKPTNIDDAIKFIYGYSQKGKYPYNTKENKKLISKMKNIFNV